jgi:voltage-gated sodium channel
MFRRTLAFVRRAPKMSHPRSPPDSVPMTEAASIAHAPKNLRERARALVEAPWFNHFIVGLIILNAITLGLETSPSVMAQAGGALHWLDKAALAIFVAELVLRFFVYRGAFFADAWRVFDFVVVGIALLPSSGAFSVLRALRVLRVLRLISMVKSMRRVVSALLAALPGMGSIVALMAIVLYVAAVMATKLFGALSPVYFGDLGKTFFTLFQIMTMEGWADIARELMAQAPWSWVFFVVYILVSTFTVLNLFIAVVVNAMQDQVAADIIEDETQHAEQAKADRAAMMAELRAMRAELAELRAAQQPR